MMARLYPAGTLLAMLLAALQAAPAAAQAPAVAPAQAEAQPRPLGRLFSSPGERASIDSQRGVAATQNGAPPGMAPAGAGGLAPMAPGAPGSPGGPPADINAPQAVTQNGIIQRSDGRSTIWINDTPQNEPNNKLLPRGGVALRLSSGRELILKPGQRYEPAEGGVHESGH